MPGSEWPMNSEKLWYSIDIGQVHYVVINTEEFLSSSPHIHLQMTWLTNDLIKANTNRNSCPWLIVMGHQPLYCSKSAMEADCARNKSILRSQLEDLFFEQGVDMYLSGHQHRYERTWPMYSSRAFQTDYTNPMAPVYIVNGAMGYTYMVDDILSKHFWLPVSVADRREVYGVLTVFNSTHLFWTAHVAESHEEIDKIHIIQHNHTSFGKPGSKAFQKIQFLHSSKQDVSNSFRLPPEPFTIVDSPHSFTIIRYRTYILYFAVLFLALVLLVFLRYVLFRKKNLKK